MPQSLENALVGRHPAAIIVPPVQFIEQMLEVGGEARGVRAKALLQPFAYGVADRSAGLVVDRFAVVVVSAVHGAFRFLVNSKR
jgi:hypothetical protein